MFFWKLVFFTMICVVWPILDLVKVFALSIQIFSSTNILKTSSCVVFFMNFERALLVCLLLFCKTYKFTCNM